MKNLKLVLVLLTIVMTSCDADSYLGSGDMISQNRNLSEFSKIKSSGIFEVNIQQGEVQNIEILADDNIINKITTEVYNGQLNIGLKKGTYRSIDVTINITVKNLTKITNEGAGDITAIDFFEIEEMMIQNSGSANIYVEGSTEHLDLENIGSGTIFAEEMLSIESTISIEGSGNCRVTCQDYLKGKIKGSGSIFYLGNPIIDSDIEGSGKIESIN